MGTVEHPLSKDLMDFHLLEVIGLLEINPGDIIEFYDTRKIRNRVSYITKIRYICIFRVYRK